MGSWFSRPKKQPIEEASPRRASRSKKTPPSKNKQAASTKNKKNQQTSSPKKSTGKMPSSSPKRSSASTKSPAVVSPRKSSSTGRPSSGSKPLKNSKTSNAAPPSSPNKAKKKPLPTLKKSDIQKKKTKSPVAKKQSIKKAPANDNNNRYVEDDVGLLYAQAPASKWNLQQVQYHGSASYDTQGKEEQVRGKSIKKGIQIFKQNPAKYLAMSYQTNMLDWPEKDQVYTLQHRVGTVGFKPTGVDPKKGWMTLLWQQYQHLPSYPNNELPMQYRDAYTDQMKHYRRLLHSSSNPPIMPGRGMGCADAPNLKIIGDIDPSDIHQGSVGDCWLLSAISALAEFDGAVKRLFRKTTRLDERPLASPNMYVISLWDISKWKEVDLVIDERLAAGRDGRLLASKPSEDGELWVCYLEKALSIHCGGWDAITGGQCVHAWAIMTGCREQYTIRKNNKTGKYFCMAKYNPNEGKWAKHYNSPKEGDGTMWQCPWPAVGGGGTGEITMEELFMKMYAWDNQNFIVGAGTKGTSDKNLSDGMVDNHAYSVIECVDNVAGTEIDLFKVRNPWGKGEIENGEFDDDGPGWDRYPQIKKALNPVVADDGIFWLTKQEFFRIFDHIYVSASDMTKFKED